MFSGSGAGWWLLVAAGLSEICYAAVIPRTEGFTRLWPTLYCGCFIALSLYLLAMAVRTLPVGTAYACLRPRASRAVTWRWPSGSGQIHTSVHAGGMTSDRKRRSIARSRITWPSGSVYVKPRPCRLRRMPGMASVT